MNREDMEMTTSTATLKKLREANDAINQPEKLNALLEEDGYLFFRGVLDAESVDAVKNDFLAVLSRQGVVKPEASEPIWTGVGVEGIDDTQLYAIPSYLKLATSDRLAKFAEKIFGEPVFLFRDANIRYALPGDSVHVTPPHQDYFFIRMNESFRTLWIPLMEINESVGGLAVAKGSHKGGLRDHLEHESAESYVFRGRKQRGVPLESVKEDWYTTNYHPGDLLMFHHLTVHRALPNRSDRIRFSLDTRCQPATAARTWQAEKSILEVRNLRNQARQIAMKEGANSELFEALFIELMKRGLAPEPTTIRGLMQELSITSAGPVT
jgi:ectoine hydroxylase-related dioxygenase (phytanoyl-CoA dioxygenase family)